jgi:predicted RecA/RadA family phage recombinase
MAQTQEAVRIAEGRSVDYTPSSDVAAGQVVVQGSMVGVAATPIPANTKGALAVEGLFSFKKKSGDTFAAGGPVYWDDTANEATTTLGSNKFCGFAAAAAGSSATEVLVSLQSIDWAGLGSVGLANLADVADTIAYTAGKILVADGTKYDDVAMSGDATLGGDGALALNAAHAEQTEILSVEDLSAGADIAARPVFVHPRAVTLVSIGILTAGAPAGVDNDNTAVVTLADDAANAIVTKTYNTATQPPSSDYEDLGALDGTHKVLTAGEHVTLSVTQGATANLPAFSIIIRYIPTNA